MAQNIDHVRHCCQVSTMTCLFLVICIAFLLIICGKFNLSYVNWKLLVLIATINHMKLLPNVQDIGVLSHKTCWTTVLCIVVNHQVSVTSICSWRCQVEFEDMYIASYHIMLQFCKINLPEIVNSVSVCTFNYDAFLFI